MVGAWGFGIAPVNEDLAARRIAAVEHVLALVDLESVAAPVESADKLSIVKGLFGRALKQDQWDWCIVWEALGSPTLTLCSQARNAVSESRRNVLAGEPFPLQSCLTQATILSLERFVGAETPAPIQGGFVCILSPEGNRDQLIVSTSEKAPSETCQSINDEQGEASLMGVRAAWRADNLAKAELAVNRSLEDRSPAGVDGLRSLDVFEAKALISQTLQSLHRYKHGVPMIECSLRSGYECNKPVALDERHCGDPEHRVGANGGHGSDRQDDRRRPRLAVNEEFDIIEETPDLDPVTFHAANCHVRREALLQVGRGPFWVQDTVQQALIFGLYWRGPLGEHLVQIDAHQFSISADGRTITRYERDTTPPPPDPQLAEPLDALPSGWAPAKLEITSYAVTYFARRHRVSEETARQELLDFVADAHARGKVDKHNGRHRLRLGAYSALVSPDGRTLVGYKTFKARRTPSEVRSKTLSRFGANRKNQHRSAVTLTDDELEDLLSELEPGQEIKGTVTTTTFFGAFIDIGGFDALIHRSQIENAPEKLEEMFPLGSSLNVRIVSIDRERMRVSAAPALREK